jgi:hypothetical protein
MLTLAAILMIAATLVYLLAPFAQHLKAPLTDGPDAAAELRELHALKDVTYETLRDVEFDFHAGKISETDYREMTDRYTREALDVVRRIDAVEARLAPSRR